MKINRQIRFLGPMLAMGIIATLVSVGVVQAHENSIDFENDGDGLRANGFASVDSSHVTFTDSQGASLFLANFGIQSDGVSLAIEDDFDDSALIMDFDVRMQSVSLDFGNDDPNASNAGDTADLTLFDGVNQVGHVAVEMNRNDAMDQTISFSAGSASECFDQAVFFYNVTQEPGLTEVVDNIVFEECDIVYDGDEEPYYLKTAAIAGLTPYADESKDIEKAIKEINKSVEDDLWVDYGHLDPKHGKKVFDRRAAKALMKVLKDEAMGKDKVSDGAEAAARAALDGLVTADWLLADVASQEASTAVVVDPNRQAKVDKELAKAMEELAKGDEDAAKGKADKAINRYKKAWEHAQRAAKEAAKAP